MDRSLLCVALAKIRIRIGGEQFAVHPKQSIILALANSVSILFQYHEESLNVFVVGEADDSCKNVLICRCRTDTGPLDTVTDLTRMGK